MCCPSVETGLQLHGSGWGWPEAIRGEIRAMCRHVSFMIGMLLLVPVGAALPGQPVRSPWSLSMAGHRGFIIPHARKLVDVSRAQPYGAELDLFWTLADERFTRRTGLVARRGVAFHYIDFDNPPVLGRMVGLTPFVEPMVRAQHRLHGSIRLGAGVAWLNRVFDAVANPTNLFFSTRLSFTGIVAANVGYRLSPQLELTGGFHFNHISNGGMKEPNKGMNFPTVVVGLVHTPHPVAITRPLRDGAWRAHPRRSDQVMLCLSAKNMPALAAAPPERTWLLGAMWLHGHRIGRLSGLAAGAEAVHDGFTRAMKDREGDGSSAWKAALLAGPELLVGRVRFGMLVGAYVLNEGRRTDAVYQRYLLQWRIGGHLALGCSLKAHRHVADVIDLRVGWCW